MAGGANTLTTAPTRRTLTLDNFPVRWPATTRWADNDMFGHLNNAVYYELFDTAINGWLRGETGIDPVTSPTPGVVAESGCRYFAELQFPDPLIVGLAVTRLGRSSVTYQLGLFGRGPGAPTAAAASATGSTSTSTATPAARPPSPTTCGRPWRGRSSPEPIDR